jgi:hypothetical protein
MGDNTNPPRLQVSLLDLLAVVLFVAVSIVIIQHDVHVVGLEVLNSEPLRV